MTRKERLYDLMARRQKISLAEMSVSTRSTARRTADMTATMCQLDNLLAETRGGLDRVHTKADMMATHWMGAELAAHLDETREHVSRLESELTRSRALLAQAEHRCGLYEDRATTARHEARDDIEARREASQPARGTGRAG